MARSEIEELLECEAEAAETINHARKIGEQMIESAKSAAEDYLSDAEFEMREERRERLNTAREENEAISAISREETNEEIKCLARLAETKNDVIMKLIMTRLSKIWQ